MQLLDRVAHGAGHVEGGAGQGEYWLQTVEQTLMQIELGGGDVTTPPGSIEVIYDALAIAGQVPAHLEGA